MRKVVTCPSCKEEYVSYAQPHKSLKVVSRCEYCKSKDDRERARAKRLSKKI